MSYASIVAWVVSHCRDLRLSQRKTLADLVVGAMRCRRVSLADMGRAMVSRTSAKHRIKRIWRFLRNERVTVADGARALLLLAAKASAGRLVVAVDWVDVRRDHVLRAAAPLRGRSVPLLAAAHRTGRLRRSQNALEEAFFALLKSLLPKGTDVVIVADRGFGRAELARTLQTLGLGYVIRVRGDVHFAGEGHTGALGAVALRRGAHRDLGFGAYRQYRPVRQRVVAFWRTRENGPWFLATDRAWGWRKVVQAYGLRMQIEELFRDEKNLRFGWGLRQSRLSTPERLERLLLVLAFAYLFLLLLGLVCEATHRPGTWSATNAARRRQASAFFVGRIMQETARLPARTLLRALADALGQQTPENWG